VFHGRKGELREAYHAGMEDQLGALGLVTNCITLWNTVYLDMILDQLRKSGYPVREEDVARLHPYWYKHINVAGHYSFHAQELGAAATGRSATRTCPTTNDQRAGQGRARNASSPKRRRPTGVTDGRLRPIVE
jgi:hypothetical protein